MKETTVARIFYGLAIIGFVSFLITKKTYLMFCGGLFLTVASIIMIVVNTKMKKK